MDIPKLEANKCSVLIAEYATGHVFKKDLTLFLNGDDEQEVFKLFDNFYEADSYVLNFIKANPEFEYSIFNDNGEHLKTIDMTGKREFDV